MKQAAPIIGKGPHPTGETHAVRGFTGKREGRDANGNPQPEWYYKGRRWHGPTNRLGCRA